MHSHAFEVYLFLDSENTEVSIFTDTNVIIMVQAGICPRAEI